MKKYEEPKLEIQTFDLEDVITDSIGDGSGDGVDLPHEPV